MPPADDDLAPATGPAVAPDLDPALAWAERTVGPVAAVEPLRGGWTSTMLALTPVSGPPAVLRLMTVEPWRSHGAALTARESAVQRELAGTPVPVPTSLALDADGAACGHPAHLMTRLPGAPEPDRDDPSSLGALAELLARIHAVRPRIEVRPYESWAPESKRRVPAWARDGAVWQAAFDLLRQRPPDDDPVLLHRDFQPRNVLWSHGRPSGVVDWVETSRGPAWLDVAHCATHLTLRHGTDVADRFAAAYVTATGRRPQPHLDVMDLVGLLPVPGREPLVVGADERARVEERLEVVLART